MGRARTGKGIFPRTSRSGRVRWIVPYRGGDGVWRQKSASTLKSARDLKVELDHRRLMEDMGVVDVAAQAQRLSTVAQAYLMDLEIRVTPMTFVGAKRAIRRMLASLPEKLTVGRLRATAIQSIQAQFVSQGLAHRTINKIIGQFRAMLRWAESTGRIVNPLKQIPSLPTGGKYRQRSSLRLTADECRQLVAAARDLDNERQGIPQAPLIETMLMTGFRWSEACSLRWGDLRRLDSDGKETWWLTVRSAYAKTGEQRSNPIPIEHARRLLEVRAKQGAVLGHLATDADFIHPTRSGAQWRRPTNDGNCRRWFRIVAKRAKLDGVTADGRRLHIHALRGTYCTLLREKMVPVEVAKELMGHKTFYLTMQIYTEGERIPRASIVEALPSLEPSKKTDASSAKSSSEGS